MQTITFEVPVLYGDHHVSEVRRLLIEIPGVKDIYASSAFQYIEVKFDEKKISEQEIGKKLMDAGYLGDWMIQTKGGKSKKTNTDAKKNIRHTAVYEQTKSIISFPQDIGYEGRPLWPCPGIGTVRGMDEENE